jgi:hypothetical protein
MKAAVRACERAGLLYERRHKHPRVVHPDTGRFVVLSHTPSCPHGYKHLLRDVKKYLGVEVTL